MSSIVASTRYLPDSSVRSHAPARAEIVQALAGKARVLAELATGAPVADGEGLATALNPQGLIGIDFSGPPWGSALRCGVALMDGVVSAMPSLVQPPTRYAIASGQRRTVGRWRVVNRQYAALPSPSIAPHSRARIMLGLYRSSGTGTITATVTARNHWLAQDGTTSSDVATVASIAAADIYDGGFIRLRPGANEISIEITHDDASKVLEVFSIGLIVDEKRSY